MHMKPPPTNTNWACPSLPICSSHLHLLRNKQQMQMDWKSQSVLRSSQPSKITQKKDVQNHCKKQPMEATLAFLKTPQLPVISTITQLTSNGISSWCAPTWGTFNCIFSFAECQRVDGSFWPQLWPTRLSATNAFSFLSKFSQSMRKKGQTPTYSSSPPRRSVTYYY